VERLVLLVDELEPFLRAVPDTAPGAAQPAATKAGKKSKSGKVPQPGDGRMPAAALRWVRGSDMPSEGAVTTGPMRMYQQATGTPSTGVKGGKGGGGGSKQKKTV
jgi:hypothetical protein